MPSYSLSNSFTDTDDDSSVCATVGDAAEKRKVFDCVENSAEYTQYNTVALNTRSAKKASGVAKSATFPLESGLKKLAATKVAAPARSDGQGRSAQSSKKRDVNADADGEDIDEEATLATVFGNSVITPAKVAKASEERFEPKAPEDRRFEPKTSRKEDVATAKEADRSLLATPPKSKGGTWLPDHILPSALDSILARNSTPAPLEIEKLKSSRRSVELSEELFAKTPNNNGDDGEDAPPELNGLDSKSATNLPAEESVAENPSASHSFDANDEELEEPVAQSLNQVFLYKMKLLDHSYQWSGVHADVEEDSGPYNSHYDVHRKRIVLMLDNPGKTEDIIAMCLRNNEDLDIEEMIRQFDYFSM